MSESSDSGFVPVVKSPEEAALSRRLFTPALALHEEGRVSTIESYVEEKPVP